MVPVGSSEDAVAAARSGDGEALPEHRRPDYAESLRESIQSLSPLQREVIQADLRSGDVADTQELARVLKTTTNTIYVTRVHARKKLRIAMRERGYFGGTENEKEDRPA